MYGELFNKNNLTDFTKTMVDDEKERNTDMKTKQPLFCNTNNFNLNVNDIRSIIKDAHDAHDSEGTIPVSYLLFVGLNKTFPCF